MSRNASEMAQIAFVCCDVRFDVAPNVCILLVSVLVHQSEMREVGSISDTIREAMQRSARIEARF